MSNSPLDHADLVQLALSLSRNIDLWRCWPDLIPPWNRGEHPDAFGLFTRTNDHAWDDPDGGPVKVNFGDTFLWECKTSVADLRKDEGKEWRDPNKVAIGNFRAFLTLEGIIDQSDLIGSPWGHWEVTSDGECRMMRAPQRIHQVNRGHELMLLTKLIDKANGNGTTGQRKAQSSNGTAAKLTSDERRGVRNALGDLGCASLVEIAKWLRSQSVSQKSKQQLVNQIGHDYHAGLIGGTAERDAPGKTELVLANDPKKERV